MSNPHEIALGDRHVRPTQDLHYLNLMASRLESQIDYIHRKQAIVFSLSTGMLALTFYYDRGLIVMLPFAIGIMIALISIVPNMVIKASAKQKPNLFFYGTMPTTVEQIDEMSEYDYADQLMKNLNDLRDVVVSKNKLITWSARCFFVGIVLLLGHVVFPTFLEFVTGFTN